MPRVETDRLPITPITVTIDGRERPGTDEIWACISFMHARTGTRWSSRDKLLFVAICNPDLPFITRHWTEAEIRPKDRYYAKGFEEFSLQRNGMWMLVRNKIAS